MDAFLAEEGVAGCVETDMYEWTPSTPSQVVGRLAEDRELGMRQHQHSSTDPERSLA